MTEIFKSARTYLSLTVATTFDLFGTLVTTERPDDSAEAVADALRARGVAVPDDWESAYRERHVDVADGAELPLPRHVVAALDSRGVDVSGPTAVAAVLDAFDRPITVRDGAREALRVARRQGPVGLLSNCSVPGLVERTLERAGFPTFDTVVTSVGCGWRKPHRRAFETVADELGVPPTHLVHVGDSAADAGIERVGGRCLHVEETPLPHVATELEASLWE